MLQQTAHHILHFLRIVLLNLSFALDCVHKLFHLRRQILHLFKFHHRFFCHIFAVISNLVEENSGFAYLTVHTCIYQIHLSHDFLFQIL